MRSTATFPPDPIDQVLSQLPSAIPNGNGWIALCPAHDDRNPSLSIRQGDRGCVLLNCFAGCEFDAIVQALNLDPADLFQKPHPRRGRRGRR